MIKRGSEIKGGVDLKEVTLKIKGDEIFKVVLISTEDYVCYPAHNEFDKKIYPQSCFSVSGDKCPLCDLGVAKADRFTFAFYVIAQKKIMFLHTTYTQGMALSKLINKAKEDIEYGSVYELCKTGSGSTTAYALNVVSERKLTKDDKEAIETAKQLSVTDEMFEDVCRHNSEDFVVKLLSEAGYNVEAKGYTVKAETEEAETKVDADLPFTP